MSRRHVPRHVPRALCACEPRGPRSAGAHLARDMLMECGAGTEH